MILKTPKKSKKVIQECIINSLPKEMKENLEKIQNNIEKAYQECVNFDNNLNINKKRNFDGDEGIYLYVCIYVCMYTFRVYVHVYM
jgi:hypothetical protein